MGKQSEVGDNEMRKRKWCRHPASQRVLPGLSRETGRNVLQVDGKCPALSQARALFADCSSADNLSQRLPINRVLFVCAS